MHLVQLLLPLYDNDGRSFGEEPFGRVRHELTEQFGGVTAYMRAPATGLWKHDEGEFNRDEIIIVEVMVDTIDHRWWRAYRERLAARFLQDEVVIRATQIERL